ncbi:MAG: tetratricopeptide repeat protein [Magnetococcus sp. XQGC-1]
MQRAFQHHRAGHLPEAEAIYRQIVTVQPDHGEALHQLGCICYQQGQPEAAVEWMGKAVLSQPDHPVFLKNLGLIQVALGRWAEAATSFRQLLAIQPDNPDLLHRLGESLQHLGCSAEAEACYRQALARQPTLHETQHSLGNLLRTTGNVPEALACYRRTLELSPAHHNAWINMGRLLLEQGETAEAISCFRHALAIQPTLHTAMDNLGTALRMEGKLDEAIACHRQVLTLQPAYHTARHNQGLALQLQEKYEEAIDCYQQVLAIQPNALQTLHALAALFLQKKRYQEAIPHYRHLIANQPNHAEAYVGLGAALRHSGQLPESLLWLQKGLAIHPDHYQMLVGLGNALLALGKPDEAIACYRRAIHLHPDRPNAHHYLGEALRQQGKLAESIPCYQRALAIDPSQCQTYNGLGIAWYAQNREEEAGNCFQKALELQPDDPHVLNNMGILRNDQGKHDEAIVCYQRAVAADPRWLAVQVDLLHQMLHICDWNGFQRRCQQMLELFHAEQQAASPFIFLSLPVSPEEYKRCAELSIQNGFPVRDNLAARQHYQSNPDRLKIGYLSFDYKDHPCGYVAADLFPHHDRSRFEVIAYSLSPPDDSTVRARIAAGCDQFVDLHPLNHHAAAQRILDDGVHILVDANGFTQGMRLQIMALRPAPIQVAWQGNTSMTLGAPFIDYCLTDHFMAPPGYESQFCEKLVRLPHHFQSRRTPAPTTPSRRECGLPEEGFVFVCFNKPYKINPPLFDLWMRLLHKIPASILWLRAFNPWAVENLSREAEQRGVERSRLIFAPRAPTQEEHVARYRLADLALDTHPYTSGSTAWDTLSAGCPMVSCAGKTGFSRAAASQLLHVGLPDLVAHSLEEYEQLAMELASNPARLSAIRTRLQANLPTAPLFDAPLFAKHLEQAFQIMWQCFQSGEAPEHIQITASSNTNHPDRGAPSPDPVDTQAQQQSWMQEATQHYRAGRLDAAEALYRQLLAMQPDHGEALHMMGELCHRRGQPALAAEWIGKAVQAAPNQPVFWKNLGLIRAGLGQWAESIPCFQQVLAIQPDHPDTLFRLGESLRHLGRSTAAESCYRQTIALQPSFHEAHHSLGILLQAAGKVAEAVACYRTTVELCPNHHNAQVNMGRLLLNQGDTAEAIACFRQALAIQPAHPAALDSLGNALRMEGKLDEAIACHQQALAIQPSSHAAHHNLGLALQLRGEPEQAAACYRKTLALRPDLPLPYYHLGIAMESLGRIAEAIACFQKAVELQPDLHLAHYHLGNLFRGADQRNEAHSHYQKALEIQPDNAHVLGNLGLLLADQGRLDEAVVQQMRAAELAPDWPAMQCQLLYRMLSISDWRDYQARLQRTLLLFRESQQEVSPYLFTVFHTMPDLYKRCAELFVQNKYPVRDNLAATRTYPANPERLTIGYISNDFKNHPCGYVAADFFPHHDRSRFQVIAYSLCADDNSSVRQRIVAGSDQMVDLQHLDHQAAARRILDDEVHILVDLTGFTKGTRLEILALRPAPIQAAWMGTAGTLGAPFADYCLTDYFVAPPGSEVYFTEQLVRLPHYFQARRALADTTPTRRSCGLPEKGMVFVCFNQPYKINPPMFDAWMRLLRALPGSVLWLREFNPWAVDNLRREAENRGVAAARLVFAPNAPDQTEHVARYRLADLALDTYPYPSGSTGWDTLSAGCPMVSCVGQVGLSRFAGTQLLHVGLPDLVTYSLEEYEQLALALASDPARLAAIRRRLQDNLPTAPLFDAPLFAKHLEEAYWSMWQRFQAGLAPEHIHIAPPDDTHNLYMHNKEP